MHNTYTQQRQVPSALSRAWWNCGQRSETNSPHNMGYIASCWRQTRVVYYYGFTMIYHQKTYPPKKKDTNFLCSGCFQPYHCMCVRLQFWIVFLGQSLDSSVDCALVLQNHISGVLCILLWSLCVYKDSSAVFFRVFASWLKRSPGIGVIVHITDTHTQLQLHYENTDLPVFFGEPDHWWPHRDRVVES